jgi:hypothetical protein
MPGPPSAPADRRDGALSPDERIAIVEAIERREAAAVRKAAGLAWLSVAAAAVLLSVIVFGAWRQLQGIRREVVTLEQQQVALREANEKQQAANARLDAEYREKQAALSTLIGAVRRTDDRSRSGMEVALDADPAAMTLVPRAYVNILDTEDRRWANNLGDRLQHAGVIPVGIEHIHEPVALKRFEVRYYKKDEEAAARRIISVLENAGVPATPVYLSVENNAQVRRNTFEIWCPNNARSFKLRPLPTPTVLPGLKPGPS